MPLGIQNAVAKIPLSQICNGKSAMKQRKSNGKNTIGSKTVVVKIPLSKKG